MISQEQIDLMERYAKVRQLQDKLTEEEKELKAKILPTLEKTETSEFGIFTPVKLTKYTYSNKLTTREKEAKQEVKEYQEMKLEAIIKAKKIEELDGTATATENLTMSYRGIK